MGRENTAVFNEGVDGEVQSEAVSGSGNILLM